MTEHFQHFHCQSNFKSLGNALSRIESEKKGQIYFHFVNL